MSMPDPVDAVVQHVKHRGSITNRECRHLLSLSYDQAIFLLGGLCELGLLSRKGASSGTHYVLSNTRIPAKAIKQFRHKMMSRFL